MEGTADVLAQRPATEESLSGAMTWQLAMITLSERLQQPELLVAPGCYDALSALLIERAGFEAAYVSGASIAYTRFGRPDIGLVSFSEVADCVAAIRERVAIPLIVDIDTGFGNALNVQRTVKLLARAGASALQLEDQVTPKRCGHLNDKQLVSTGEMVGKIKAALDARPDREVLAGRAHRCHRGRRFRRPRSIAPKPMRRPAPTSCSSRRRNRPTSLRRSAGASRAESRCWPTWSKAARRR